MKTKNLLLAATAIVAFAMTVTAQTIPSYIPTNGLVGWWPFNGNANDESGNGNHGIVNGATLTTDRNGNTGKAYGLTNLNDNIYTNNINPTFNGSNSLTVSFWMNFPQQYNYSTIFLVKNGTAWVNGFSISVDQNNSAYGLNVYQFTIIIGSTPCSFFTNQLELGSWSNIIGVYNGSQIKLYLNNVLKATVNYNSNIVSINGNLIFAEWGNPTPPSITNRNIDDIAIYNRALTQQEITALYTGVPPCTPTSSTTSLTIPSTSLPYTWNGLTFNAAGSQTKHLTNASGCDSLATLNLTVNYTLPNYIPTNGLLGYWPFNGNANDESGNGNHGTVNGATYAQVVSNSKSGYGISSVSDKITLPTIQCNNILKYSVAGWFKKNSNPAYPNIDGTIFSQSNGCGGSNGLRLFIGTDNHIYFLAEQLNGTCNSVGKYNVNTNYNDGNWHFFVAMFESNGGTITSSNFTLNLDGVNSNDNWYLGSAIVAPIPNLTNSTTFGNVNSSVDGMVGNIDDFVIYNRILTQTEITQLYTNCVATTSTTNLTIPSTSLPYTWNGLTFNASGSQTKHLTNAAGCDSTATLNLTVINTALPSYLPTNGLVGWWPFNGNANDESGNGNHGTVNGASLTSDRFGNNNSYYFNGNANILVNNSNSLQVGTNQTISLWIKVNSLQPNLNWILQKGTGGGCQTTGYYVAFDGNGTIFHRTFNFGQNSNYCATIGDYSNYDTNWHQLIFVYSPPYNKMYIDGVLAGNGMNCSTCNVINSSNPLIIGSGSGQNGFKWDGKIDDIAIYNRALTQSEITALYSSTQNTINLKLNTFLEGSYSGNSSMNATPNKVNAAISNNIADTINVELHANTSPYTTMYSSKGVVNINGTATIAFPDSAIGSSYYIVIKHRNSIETWSAAPVVINNNSIYNFTTSASQAFGDNLNNMGDGVFGIYSGDINQDGSVDFNDYPSLDIASNGGILGYDANDLNGDASVDFNDYPILDINSNNGILAIKP